MSVQIEEGLRESCCTARAIHKRSCYKKNALPNDHIGNVGLKIDQARGSVWYLRDLRAFVATLMRFAVDFAPIIWSFVSGASARRVFVSFSQQQEDKLRHEASLAKY